VPDYGYRYYDPATGRWPSRDPIEEESFRLFYERDERKKPKDTNEVEWESSELVDKILTDLPESTRNLVQSDLRQSIIEFANSAEDLRNLLVASEQVAAGIKEENLETIEMDSVDGILVDRLKQMRSGKYGSDKSSSQIQPNLYLFCENSAISKYDLKGLLLLRGRGGQAFKDCMKGCSTFCRKGPGATRRRASCYSLCIAVF
jgi:hypothetical protein